MALQLQESFGVKYISQIEAANINGTLKETQIAHNTADIKRFLLQMSQEWRKKIYDAAVSCSDENIT
jgi:hypothetical protein